VDRNNHSSQQKIKKSENIGVLNFVNTTAEVNMTERMMDV